MTQSDVCDPGSVKEAKLPRHDWVLLPLLSLLTICAIAIPTELIARRSLSGSGREAMCHPVLNDPATGPRVIPNSVCWEKIPEGPWVEFRFNSCGHRAGMECGPKPPGTYRIVMVGSSVVLGQRVQREKTIAALLPEELSQDTGRRIELYNEGMFSEHPRIVAEHFHEFLGAKPDMILWLLSPYDLKAVSFLCEGCDNTWELPASAAKAGTLARAWYRIKVDLANDRLMTELWQRMGFSPEDDPAGILLRHFFYTSQGQTVKSYLMAPDDEAGFLKAEPSAEWKSRLRQFDTYSAGIEVLAKAADVPLVVTFMPNRAQAAMISMGEWPAGYNPYKLGDELRSIVTSHGGIYIDILPYFSNIPNPEKYYFPVDGHPDANGHAMIAEMLAKALTGGAVPALKVEAQPQAAQEQGR